MESGRAGAGDLPRGVVTEHPHLNELILEVLAEIDEDFATLRQMSDEELGRLCREWLQRRHPEWFPTMQRSRCRLEARSTAALRARFIRAAAAAPSLASR